MINEGARISEEKSRPASDIDVIWLYG